VAQNSLQSIVPDLATDWSWNEDGTELTFRLRSGVKWHDGHPFTANDVNRTWDLLLGKAPLLRNQKFADSPLEGTGLEPSVPLLQKALLGVANRRRRHGRRSHLQVQVRNGNTAWSGCPQPFPSRRDREFEAVFLQRRVSCELTSGVTGGAIQRLASGVAFCWRRSPFIVARRRSTGSIPARSS
jgi:Bacterial extracellular solute-binding proteins, family 5 Middle